MPTSTALIIGASRGLGLALAEEYLERGWRVVATVRGEARTRLHDLVAKADRRLEVESVDIVEPEEVARLRARLAMRRFDLLFATRGSPTVPTRRSAGFRPRNSCG